MESAKIQSRYHSSLLEIPLTGCIWRRLLTTQRRFGQNYHISRHEKQSYEHYKKHERNWLFQICSVFSFQLLRSIALKCTLKLKKITLKGLSQNFVRSHAKISYMQLQSSSKLLKCTFSLNFIDLNLSQIGPKKET